MAVPVKKSPLTRAKSPSLPPLPRIPLLPPTALIAVRKIRNIYGPIMDNLTSGTVNVLVNRYRQRWKLSVRAPYPLGRSTS